MDLGKAIILAIIGLVVYNEFTNRKKMGIEIVRFKVGGEDVTDLVNPEWVEY